jgi:hypothetical protein
MSISIDMTGKPATAGYAINPGGSGILPLTDGGSIVCTTHTFTFFNGSCGFTITQNIDKTWNVSGQASIYYYEGFTPPSGPGPTCTFSAPAPFSATNLPASTFSCAYKATCTDFPFSPWNTFHGSITLPVSWPVCGGIAGNVTVSC